MIKNRFTIIFLITAGITSSSSLAQSDSLKCDSLITELNDCWKTKYYQFKYDSERNIGGEYKSPIRSSAPFFILTLKENEVYLSWVELLGGGYDQKVLSVNRRRLRLENESGSKITYKRNMDCENKSE